jgi:hypothetical protein
MFSSNLDSYEAFDNFQSLANDEQIENSAGSGSYKGDVIVEECYSDEDSDTDQGKTSVISMNNILAFNNLSAKKSTELSPNS